MITTPIFIVFYKIFKIYNSENFININFILIEKIIYIEYLFLNSLLYFPSNSCLCEGGTTELTSKLTGLTDKEIASALNRSYWGVVDKIRRLKLESKL
ncbi:MAG: hypothetical protein K0S30_600 [Clostridia bacterium]|jgi:hypothetical protein|nr:hypothetical protein [Clostridia bacterium]